MSSVSKLALALALSVAACSGGSGGGAVEGGRVESFERLTLTNDAGTRSYKVYVPPALPAGAPLVVDLHGCGSDADEESRWSRFNEFASAEGFLVVYPEQDPAANGSRCWNWFLPDHQARDAGEPSLIADITREVVSRFDVDPARVYVAGISAGGAMADIMAVTYPDLYAAAMVYAGCEYKGTTCLGSVAALPAETSGQLAYEAMGPRARVVPVIVIQGDADPVVPYPNADLVVQQFLASDDWADDGANDGSVARTPSATRSGSEPGGRSYDVDSYTDAEGVLIAERWLIRGMGHAWSHASSDGSARDELLTDAAGPDVTGPVIRFFLDHPLPAASN